MKKNLLTVAALTLTLVVRAQDIPVFVSGEDGHESYRIPAMVKAPNGDLLAFAEGRVHNAQDFGDINIVMRRSTDQGKTWGALQIVVDYDKLQAGNPAPIVDLLDPAHPQGRIFLFYNTGNNHEYEMRNGLGLREVWYVTSVDGGNSWSDGVNITTRVHRPNHPQSNPDYNFREDWRAYANTPGHGIQFDKGKFKGRIFIAANHSKGNFLPDNRDYKAHGYYTDDHGRTFRLAESVPFEGGNESMAALVDGDKLLMNVRNQRGNVRARIISISSDGGTTWDTTYYDQQLPDPINQGSLLAFEIKGKRYLAFCNTADTAHRNNLTLRISRDSGRTWFFNRTIARAPEGYERDYAAYSDLVDIGKKRIGVLYEKDAYGKIVFTTVKWK